MTGAVDLWGCAGLRLIDRWNSGWNDSGWKEESSMGTTGSVLEKLRSFGRIISLDKEEGKPEVIDKGHSGGDWHEYGVYAWWEEEYFQVWQKVDTWTCTVTSRELKENPSLLNAFAKIALEVGKVVPQIKQLSEAIDGANTWCDICDNIKACIDNYGKVTDWTINLGTITYTRRCELVRGEMYIIE